MSWTEPVMDHADARAYEVIASNQQLTVEAVASRLGESVGECTTRVRRLTAMGLIERVGDRVVARHSDAVRRDDLAFQQSLLAGLAMQLSRSNILARAHGTAIGPSSNELQALDDARLGSCLMELLESAASSAAFVLDSGIGRSCILDLTAAAVAAAGRGVEIRVLVDDHAAEDAMLTALARLRAADCEVRTVTSLPLGVVIVDRSVAVLCHRDPDGSTLHGAAARSPLLAAPLAVAFEKFWASAGPPSDRADSSLSCLQQQILTLLACGHTDDAIAHRLGISRRTVSRVVADLLLKTSARSRFELGCKAALNRWAGTVTSSTLPRMSPGRP
ncbi:winged helix-turn-helix transcriptional regulator [Flexivirga sp. ID2601S]|uniref:Winged helix-turn-helix transcriptional regulator n=1 Tax=Flexivirga aerilata TaxID=1656889 RepID=A0A849AI27_9MICO|nr:winged helix-turn-helix transcriptional regulator [Flexivirga aerilata]NNG40049.1 winged helix-turn-helix transcriptional regulator [Flexivirga aerilata]